jgi:hypothetical protein
MGELRRPHGGLGVQATYRAGSYADKVLNILLALIALAALLVALGQLRLQRTNAGGRGLLSTATVMGPV